MSEKIQWFDRDSLGNPEIHQRSTHGVLTSTHSWRRRGPPGAPTEYSQVLTSTHSWRRRGPPRETQGVLTSTHKYPQLAPPRTPTRNPQTASENTGAPTEYSPVLTYSLHSWLRQGPAREAHKVLTSAHKHSQLAPPSAPRRNLRTALTTQEVQHEAPNIRKRSQ